MGAAVSDGCCFPNAVGWDPTNGDSPNYVNLMADMSRGDSGDVITLSGLAPDAYTLWVYTPFGLSNMTANLDSQLSYPYDDSDRILGPHTDPFDLTIYSHSMLLNPFVLGGWIADHHVRSPDIRLPTPVRGVVGSRAVLAGIADCRPAGFGSVCLASYRG